MKNIVIAAGYATRLGELTKNFPKPLLKIGDSTILGRMLDDIDKIDDVDEHIIITNHKFAGIFEDVLGMEEKPQAPKSHWAVPPFYIYLKKDLDLVRHSEPIPYMGQA